jgi:ElaB/YqjD/DUF883 family membrane-anchored ribosome-binding protein
MVAILFGKLRSAQIARFRRRFPAPSYAHRDSPALIMSAQPASRPAAPWMMEVLMAANESARAKLVEDFSAVLAEAEDMLKRAATETGEKARDLRTQVEAKLLTAKLRLQELEGQAIDHAKAAARATDDYVHDNPWQAIGVAAAVGFLVGLVISRR